ncbi:MAG TPA: ATP-binding protein, partial [Sphingomonas sp.]|nr:ATP-binding protein [Sphingomonas sp.]
MRAEINRRGYLLTGRPEHLTRFGRVNRDLPGPMADVVRMTVDDPAVHRHALMLQRVLLQRIAEMDRTIRLYRAGKAAEAIAITGSVATARSTMTVIRLLAVIRAGEARLMEARSRRANMLRDIARAELTAVALLIVLLAGLAWRDRRLQLLALREANAQLAIDVQRREDAEAQLALLADHATDGVFRLTRDGVCLYASPSVREVLGYAPEALIGRQMLSRFHPADRDAVRAAHGDLASGVRDKSVVTYRARHPQYPGQWIWLEASSGLVRDPLDGTPLEIVTSLRNVTERKAMELQLQAARGRAEAAVIAKASFLANMSHEIRTPMNGVVGFTDLLLASDLSREQRRHAAMIAESSRAMMRLLNDILDLSKVEAGEMKVAAEPFELAHTLRGCLQLMTPATVQKGLTLNCDIADALPVMVVGDGLRLRQIVLNLLGNAAKFTARGSITLRAAPAQGPEGPQMVIAVADTGIGIAPDRQAAIFAQFVQADAGTAATYGGTGLGLAISVHLARAMGGDLRLESVPGVGTTFFLTLPLIASTSSAPVRAPGGAAPDAGRAAPMRVLVAEDNGVNQMLITAMLKQMNCRIDIAPDGRDAVAKATAARDRDDPYALVFMDMQMPFMDGLEATRAIRAAGLSAGALPVVALTANAYPDDIAACEAAGMQAHLAKPIKLADLQDAIGRHAAVHAAHAVLEPI